MEPKRPTLASVEAAIVQLINRKDKVLTRAWHTYFTLLRQDPSHSAGL